MLILCGAANLIGWRGQERAAKSDLLVLPPPPPPLTEAERERERGFLRFAPYECLTNERDKK